MRGGGYSPLLPSGYAIVFDPPDPKNGIYHKFFTLINAIQINKTKSSFVSPASKIAFIKLSPT